MMDSPYWRCNRRKAYDLQNAVKEGICLNAAVNLYGAEGTYIVLNVLG